MVHPTAATPAAYPPLPPSPGQVSDAGSLQAKLIQVFERLANQPPIVVEAIDETCGEVRHWFTSGPADVLGLRLLPEDRDELRARAPAELERWWRAAAATKRVWQRRDTELRAWKSAQIVAGITPPEEEPEEESEDKKAAKPKKWSRPSQWELEARYRAEPDYVHYNNRVERAEEAHSACLGVLDAWQTIARLLEALGG